jgi:hypothetical protein
MLRGIFAIREQSEATHISLSRIGPLDFSQIAIRQDLVSIRQKLGSRLGIFL